MNNAFKLGIAAAVAVLVGDIGINLLPGTAGTGGGAAAPASPSPGLGASATPTRSLDSRLPEAGRLVYERDGDIYLADPDGSHPTRVAEGSLPEGRRWAPDGGHFLYLESGAQSSAHISDPDGHVVASFANLPGFNGFPVWSPDSTRLQAWTDNFTRISVYGIDGVLQTALPLPDGYTRFRENLGVWAPDGRSVWVLIDPPSTDGAEAWQLPIDGSTPDRLPDDHPFTNFELSVSRAAVGWRTRRVRPTTLLSC